MEDVVVCWVWLDPAGDDGGWEVTVSLGRCRVVTSLLVPLPVEPRSCSHLKGCGYEGNIFKELSRKIQNLLGFTFFPRGSR